MAKTKIFWIAKKVNDVMQMWGYNNKRKAEEKGLELYGVGITDFSFNLDGEEFEDENGSTAYISSGQIDSFGHFLLYRADGMPGAIGLEQERAATEYVESELPNSAGACFPAKLKGGSCDVYMSSAVEANGAMWTFEDGEVNEQKETMRHIPTFEQFVTEKFKEDRDFKEQPVTLSFTVEIAERDYQAAVKQIDAFIKKNKIKAKPKYNEPTMDSPGIIRLALVKEDLPDREGKTNLRPLLLQLGNLETAQHKESDNHRLGLDLQWVLQFHEE